MSDTATQTQLKHAPGSFCWIELMTTDGPGAKKFYSDLFGWEGTDNPIGPGMVYTIYTVNGKAVAGRLALAPWLRLPVSSSPDWLVCASSTRWETRSDGSATSS